MSTADNPNAIHVFHLCALKGAVKLEQKGLRRRGRSAKAIAIDELKLPKGAKYEEVIKALEDRIAELTDFSSLEGPPVH